MVCFACLFFLTKWDIQKTTYFVLLKVKKKKKSKKEVQVINLILFNFKVCLLRICNKGDFPGNWNGCQACGIVSSIAMALSENNY